MRDAVKMARPGTGVGASRMRYLPGLDGLRALSVVAVLLYHADVAWLPGGFLGVEVFFVVSGYLITLLLVREHDDSGGIAVARFWRRRARRLLAALYTLLTAVSIVVLVAHREDAARLGAQVWAALGYVTNWYLIVSEQSYFALAERPPVFQHLWSLAIEEQFYLVWPLVLTLLLGVTRRRRPLAAAVCVAGAGASLWWMAALHQPAVDPSRAYYGTDTRASGLLVGAALALVWSPRRPRADAVRPVGLDIAGGVGLGVVLAAFASIEAWHPFLYPGGFAVVSVASCAAIAAVVHGGTAIGVALGRPALTWIGRRSYSLYLWHWPIFVYTRPELDVPWGPAPTLALRLVLTVLAAEASYRFVEVPVRNGAFERWCRRLARRSGARRRTAPILLATAAALLLVAVTVAGPTGRSSLDELTGQAPAAAAGAGVTTAAATRAPAGTTTATTLPPAVAPAPAVTSPPPSTTTTTSAPPNGVVTVLGDSVLLGASAALSAELTADGYGVDVHARPAMMLRHARDELAAAGQPVGPTVVVGLGHNSLWERDRRRFDEWAELFDTEADELVETLRTLGAARIVWVTLGEPSPDVIPAAGRQQQRAFLWYFPYVNERLDALAARHPDVVLADWAAVSDAAGLTYDAMHLTGRGIRLMIDTIRRAGDL